MFGIRRGREFEVLFKLQHTSDLANALMCSLQDVLRITIVSLEKYPWDSGCIFDGCIWEGLCELKASL
jgi:hypothetical protein